MLCLMLPNRRREFPILYWAQALSMCLLVAHNYQLYFDQEAYKHWWYSFDVANDAIEIAYLFDLRNKSVLGFSVIAGIVATTKVDYIAYEAGHKAFADSLTHARQIVDCASMFLLAVIVYRYGGTHGTRTLHRS